MPCIPHISMQPLHSVWIWLSLTAVVKCSASTNYSQPRFTERFHFDSVNLLSFQYLWCDFLTTTLLRTNATSYEYRLWIVCTKVCQPSLTQVNVSHTRPYNVVFSDEPGSELSMDCRLPLPEAWYCACLSLFAWVLVCIYVPVVFLCLNKHTMYLAS